MEQRIERLMRWISLALGWAFVLAILINLANVVGRYVFSHAILGADEVQIFIMVWMAFLGAVVVTWRDQHLRMDVLFSFMPAWLQQLLRWVELCLMLALTVFVAWHSFQYVGQMMAIGRRSEAADIPMAIPHSAVALGFALIALIALARCFGVRRTQKPHGAAGPEGAAGPQGAAGTDGQAG